MPRDYKHRAQPKKNRSKQVAPKVAWWKWLLVLVLIAAFVGFLNFLRTSTPASKTATETQLTAPHNTAKKPKPKPKKPAKKTEKPHFEFYTRLPKETVVTDYEIKTRVREERVGKAKKAQYLIQAGSFQKFSDADKRRAQLALMGFESHIEKARVGNTVWHRVKLGPFSRPSAVTTIQTRLKKAGIDVIITEK
ncbi:SPOR domain-containing protein [methane-oxidizing endosymbiont of Gigantopelta aegis]|uniref:SPOR domain-containing protein n=1 Tax=methane-oxidizing endosymbiont of Gigantopelta aegis TaxID=2794938 RepID=UPI0018DDC3A7|nr:SPOR domain-containing protein [methane-oxidizing endosymbiont of Gigantopelta aegis]